MITITCDYDGCNAQAEISSNLIATVGLDLPGMSDGNWRINHPDERIPDIAVCLPEGWKWRGLFTRTILCPQHVDAIRTAKGGWLLPRQRTRTFMRKMAR
jgi:hypothetical protein